MDFVFNFYELGKLIVVVCYVICIFLDIILFDGFKLVEGRIWIGFVDGEE